MGLKFGIALAVGVALGVAPALAQETAPVPPQRPLTPGVHVTGGMETVFDWTTDKCAATHIPDLPARAFRNASGQVQLIVSHITGRRMVGPDLDSLAVDCAPVSESAHDPDPSKFSDNEWIAATWTADGETVDALVHNEFHGAEQLDAGVCPSGEPFRCWYNAITAMISRDGGASFGHAAEPPAHLVASYPEPYHPDGGIFGVFSPSNIIEKEGFFYAFFKVQSYLVEDQYTCLMRSPDLGDPQSWRFWDGRAFAGTFADPYRDDLSVEPSHVCPPLALDEIAQMNEGITWNTYLGKYVLVGTSSDPSLRPNRYGFYYALSDDLIHWQRRRLLLEVALPWTALAGNEVVFLYPTLIDPHSSSRNFETTGETAYLYFTRHNAGQASLDRDLVRAPVKFVRQEP